MITLIFGVAWIVGEMVSTGVTGCRGSSLPPVGSDKSGLRIEIIDNNRLAWDEDRVDQNVKILNGRFSDLDGDFCSRYGFVDFVEAGLNGIIARRQVSELIGAVWMSRDRLRDRT